MKKFLLISLALLATAGWSFGQVNVLDFETVKDPLIEPFDLTFPTDDTDTFYVANPDGEGSVGKIIKTMEAGNPWGYAFWGGINVYFGGDVIFSGTNDTITVDYYAGNAGTNDTILFKLELFNRFAGGPATVSVDGFYTDANDTETGVWKTVKYPMPDGLDTVSGSYNQMVIFFGWNYVSNGDVFYYDNVTLPGYTPYGSTEVTFEITDKFNNASDVKLFVDGLPKTLTQASNVYSHTENFISYNITSGLSSGEYEVVYSHMANDSEVRDTTSFLAGSADGKQKLLQLIIVEAVEDGTAKAIHVGETPPTIDGTIDDVWSNARTHSLQKRGWWGTPTGLYTTWKIMWDIDNVYMLYIVEDETPQGGNTTDVWKNDCIETFFDMNQSAKDGYDADDWQIRTVRGSDGWSGSSNVNDTWAGDLERAQVAMADNKGYIIEMAIPWLSLSSTFLPVAGKEFNHDATAADVTAEGGTRIFRESWTTDEDNAYLNTSKFGTITLSDMTVEPPVSVNERMAAIVSVYPNPVSDQLSVSSDEVISSCSIIDITGRTVKSVSSVNSYDLVLNVSDLREGVYLLRVSDLEGKASVQKIQIKK